MPISLWAGLRSGDWLTSRRLRAYPAILAAIAALVGGVWLARGEGAVDPGGRLIGTDFAAFYAASVLIAEGRPAGAYDDAELARVQHALAGREVPVYTNFYPPPGLLLMAPLARLSYLQALALWLAITLAAYVAVLWALWPRPLVPLLALASPAALVTIGHGQNAFLSGALLGGALLLLRRWPVPAGGLVGLLAYKPHLGLVLPLVLAAGRQWRAIAAAALAVALLSLAATAAFGWAIWPAYLHRAGFASQVLAEGWLAHHKMQSVYTALRLAGVVSALAFAVHWTVAGAAALAVALLWRGGAEWRLKAAALAASTVVVTPFVFDYDLALLGIPIVLMARDGAEHGFLPWEKTVLAAAWAVPLVSRQIGAVLAVSPGPLVSLALLALILRRAWVRG